MVRRNRVVKVLLKTPSLYGSHESMVVEENCDGSVTCRDAYGDYTTSKSVLDNGLADPNRYNNRGAGVSEPVNFED